MSMPMSIKDKKVVVIHGGPSFEREVSLMSSQSVCKALTHVGVSFVTVEGDASLCNQLLKIQPDIAFLAGHGVYAEDGTLQGLLELLKIPYTGSGVLASSICMDKIFFKQLMSQHQISIAHSITIDSSSTPLDTPPFLPCVVKPNRSGSSIGVSLCHKKEEWKPALHTASKIDSQIMIESYIAGKELAVSWLDGKVLSPVEIQPKQNHFYDFKRKYEKGQTQFVCPPQLDSNILKQLQDITQKICQICHIQSYGRADFIIDTKNNIYLLEFNTLPGLTSLSLLPRAAKQDGISYDELILKILTHAIQK